MRLRGVVAGVAWRMLKNVVTTPSILLPSLLFPLLFFVAFAGGLSQVQNVPGFDYPNGYTAFQFVFVLLQAAAFGGVFTGFAIARDFEGGFGRRLMLASPNRLGIVLGYGVAAVLRWVLTATLLTVVALVFGMQVGGGPVDLVALYMLALIINVCGFLWSAGIAMRIRTMQAAPLMQMPAFLLLFLAPVYVPLSLLGGTLHAVARFNPVTYALGTGRGLLAGDATQVGLSFGLALVLVVVFSVWALRGLRSAEAAG
ncbi:MAG: ABC transporter permease [Thermoleophilia bacterium]